MNILRTKTPENAKILFFEKINVDDTRFAVFGTRLGGRLKSGIVKLERNSKSLKRKIFRENQSEWHTFWSIWNPLKGLPQK